ncbi:TIGR03086 family metal-binding protein [Williamsia maris]|uniref:TIGR03086 family protein n=1 Tax=Williamsia maris TaxID=72806 RepID=A0ABT1HJ81_9NOCA|nr:TIGR03086 family metal-binding protein [Williamsia maris]MCP2177987.1 TIGR03086 family protein [Williamsia maris]
MFDLGPATAEMARLIDGVQDGQLDRSTPCDDWTVGELLAHIHQFTSVFADNAHKNPIRPPDGLVDDWRVAIPATLDDLAAGWREPSAWDGQVSAGGIEMSAADNAIVAIEELTVHAWDLSRATGQSVKVEDSTLDRIEQFFVLFSSDTNPDEGPFGPVAAAPEDADRLDHLIARTGRNPRWT